MVFFFFFEIVFKTLTSGPRIKSQHVNDETNDCSYLSKLFLKRPGLSLVVSGGGRRVDVGRTTAGHWRVARVVGLGRQVGRVRLPVRSGQRNGHAAGRLMLRRHVQRRLLHGQPGVLIHEMLEHGSYQPRTGRQLSGELIERFSFLSLRNSERREKQNYLITIKG